MALDIKVQNSKWGDIKLICSCSDVDTKVPFTIHQHRGLILYKCTNPECKNSFPSEIHLKVLTDVEKWIEKNGKIDGFVSYFNRTVRIPEDIEKPDSFYISQKCSMKAKYIKTNTIGRINPKSYHIIEISNLTLMPEAKKQ